MDESEAAIKITLLSPPLPPPEPGFRARTNIVARFTDRDAERSNCGLVEARLFCLRCGVAEIRFARGRGGVDGPRVFCGDVDRLSVRRFDQNLISELKKKKKKSRYRKDWVETLILI